MLIDYNGNENIMFVKLNRIVELLRFVSIEVKKIRQVIRTSI